MRSKSSLLPLLVLGVCPVVFAQSNTHIAALLDADRDTNVLTWNPDSGASKLSAYFNHRSNGWGFHEVTHQLPKVGFDSGTTQMTPVVDRDGDMNVLVWNPESGASTLYAFFDHRSAGLGFHEVTHQLPKVRYDSGTTEMAALLDADGDMNVLVWNPESGASTLFAFFDHRSDGWGFHEVTHQLPRVRYDSGTTRMAPVLDADGDMNVLVWNPESGASTLYACFEHHSEGWGFHEVTHQVPGNRSYASTGMKILLDGDRDLNILVWDAESGSSTLYAFFQHQTGGWGYHEVTHQVPAQKLGSGRLQMSAFLDRDGDMNVIAWNEVTGSSTIYAYFQHQTEGWGFHELTNQLPQ